MKIYLAGPITGKTAADVITTIEIKKNYLEGLGYQVLHPMTGKGYLRTHDGPLTADGSSYHNPVSTDHAIFERDSWMIQQADVVFADLTMSGQRVSIGTVMELAIASHLRRHTIAAIPDGDIHRHAFVLEACDIVFKSYRDAVDYLAQLIDGIS